MEIEIKDDLIIYIDDKAVDYAKGLRIIRNEKELSRQELSRILYVSIRTIEGWEQGRKPSRAYLVLLKNYLEFLP